jgi:hypothetical protein
MDFEVQRCTRHCAVSGRELASGEWFYSVLAAEGPAVVRHDFATEAWSGPPERSLGWWKSQMPALESKSKKAQWAPNDVMLQLFDELANQPERADMRYVLTLLLVRRRVLRLEDTEQSDAKQEMMLLYCPRRQTEYRVAVRMPDAVQANQIQQELAGLLLSNAA